MARTSLSNEVVLRMLGAITSGFFFANDDELHLFKNDIVPDRDTVKADLEELTGTDYTPQSTTAPIHGIDVTTGLPVFKYAVPYAFDVAADTADQVIYGWYITKDEDGALLAVGRLTEPITIPVDGVHIILAPEIYYDVSTDDMEEATLLP